jgi:hypothetical protein
MSTQANELTHMISILNSIFIVVFYMHDEMNKTISHLHIF